MKSRKSILRQAFQYQSLLETYAYAILNDWNLSEDAVQEAFISVNDKWQDLDEERLLAWLKTVTKRRAIDLVRSRKRIVQREDLRDLIESHFENFTNEGLLEMQNTYKRHLQKCISYLRPAAHKVLNGFYIEQKSTDELARDCCASVEIRQYPIFC